MMSFEMAWVNIYLNKVRRLGGMLGSKVCGFWEEEFGLLGVEW